MNAAGTNPDPCPNCDCCWEVQCRDDEECRDRGCPCGDISRLLPIESEALNAAKDAVSRGTSPEIGVTVTLIMALNRLTGGPDWTKDGAE